jgi:hypothetical protein
MLYTDEAVGILFPEIRYHRNKGVILSGAKNPEGALLQSRTPAAFSLDIASD